MTDPLIKQVVEYINLKANEVWETNHPLEAFEDNDTFVFSDGMIVREPIMVKWIIDYLRENGELK